MGRAITTNRQADTLSKLFTDLDGYRRRYSLRESGEDENILVQFVSPQIVAYEEYRYVLLKNSVTKPLKPNYYYRPDYVSYDEYGSTNLWALLLFINDIPTIEDFDVENILIPSITSISNINKDVVSRDLYNEIVPLYEIPQKEKFRLYTGKKPVPKTILPNLNAPVFVNPDLYYNKQLITVDNMMSLQRYVDLDYEPVVESIQLNIQDQPNYLYNKHYTLIKGNKAIKNRLTWDPRKLNGGLGLVDVMTYGTKFEVQYARKLR